MPTRVITPMHPVATPTPRPSTTKKVSPTGDTAPTAQGLRATFSNYTQTQDGFTFLISNFVSTYKWTARSDHGIATIDDAGQVTVTGVRTGQTPIVTVTSIAVDGSIGTASISGAPIVGEALVPDFERFTTTADGFKVHISNYSIQYNWTATATSGDVVIDKSGYVTGSNVNFGTQSLITVTASRDGYTTGASTFVANMPIGSALNPIANSSGITCSTATYKVSNFDPKFTWSVVSSAGKVSLDSSGNILMYQLGSGVAYTLTISTTRAGYAPGKTVISGTTTTGSCLAPLFDKVIQTSSGFQVAVMNFSPTFTWTVTSTAGSAALDLNTGLLTVSGLSYGQLSTVTVKTEKKGSPTSVVSLSSAALIGPAFTPEFDNPVSIVGGFTVNITNYSPSVTWSAKSSAGSATISPSGVLTVIGLQPGTSASVDVTTVLSGRQNGSGKIQGQSLK